MLSAVTDAVGFTLLSSAQSINSSSSSESSLAVSSLILWYAALSDSYQPVPLTFLKKSEKKPKSITQQKREKPNEQFLSHKRKADTNIDNIEEDIKILDKKIKQKEEQEKKQNEDTTLPLEEIIEVFHKQFENKTKEDIYQALYKTSCNIKNAYLFLLDPEKYENLAFIGTDDYIIQNLKGKQYYEQLVASKGKELISEREQFLNIN